NQESRLRCMTGRSYYRWILSLVSRNPLKIVYTPGHSDEVSIPARMNLEADHYASSAQRYIADVPAAPIPTFFMDEFTFYTTADGWIESSIRHYTDKSQISSASTTLGDGHQQRMTLALYDSKSPPEFPYTHAYSAYSAVVQLYARSGQLPVADLLYSRAKMADPQCRNGCDAVEDQHHIFVMCTRYAEWRSSAAQETLTRTNNKLGEKGIEEADRVGLLTIAKSLFTDNIDIWPLHY
ncbi:hypothetical protein B0H15DRAFT_762330, partial [Mycena belliarum]